jgi:hypothetical protein
MRACTTGRSRRLLIGMLLAALFAAVSLLHTATAQAACHPQKVSWIWEKANNWNSANERKSADGCAQPWVIMEGYNAVMRVWVWYGGAWHAGPEAPCVARQACNLYGGWAFNGYTWHVQLVLPRSGPNPGNLFF